MQYKITKVSEETPKEWGEGTNKTYYIKVMVDGHNKPISVGKKSPNALSVGDELNGTITPTEYEADKFRSEPKAFTPGVKTEDPAKQDSIIRQSSMKAAIDLVVADKIELKELFEQAQKIVAWVKNDPKTGLDKARETAESLRPAEDKKEQESLEASITDEGEINLDDIPF